MRGWVTPIRAAWFVWITMLCCVEVDVFWDGYGELGRHTEWRAISVIATEVSRCQIDPIAGWMSERWVTPKRRVCLATVRLQWIVQLLVELAWALLLSYNLYSYLILQFKSLIHSSWSWKINDNAVFMLTLLNAIRCKISVWKEAHLLVPPSHIKYSYDAQICRNVVLETLILQGRLFVTLTPVYKFATWYFLCKVGI